MLTLGLGLPQGKPMSRPREREQRALGADFRLKAYASPAKLESIDGVGPGRALGGAVPAGS